MTAADLAKRDAAVDGLRAEYAGSTRAITPGDSLADDHRLADAALAGLKVDGWVILRAESVRRAQERQRIAEARRAYADEHAERMERWARRECDEQRRLRDRITFLYGAARAHGATVEELGGTPG